MILGEGQVKKLDFYDRLDKILAEKGISRRRMAIQSGIPESTISAAFRRRSKKFSTENIIKISSALQIPLDELVGSEIASEMFFGLMSGKSPSDLPDVSSHEKAPSADNKRRETLLSHYDTLNADGQEKAVERVAELAEVPRYRKNGG